VSSLVSLLVHPVIGTVFKEIVRDRSARFSVLLRRGASSADDLKGALAQLREHKLVKSSSDVFELSTFYLTAKGLEASQSNVISAFSSSGLDASQSNVI